MPVYKLSKFTDRGTLGAINPIRLREFLLRFSEYFAARKFVVTPNAELKDSDFTKLTRILNSPTLAMPSELVEALFHIEEMSNDQGMEALMLASMKAGVTIPEDEELTPADLALHFWMTKPELLRRANYERIATSQKSFRHYLNRHRTKPRFTLPTSTFSRTKT
ncbi:hypothetical protein SH528x_002211 [Novipirellula sp. SH528]|uniref:hypothetical protein n=1 Tax=Novipirellula sp. SH528 TaxID=3454466 RepID=UPI003FA0E8A7